MPSRLLASSARPAAIVGTSPVTARLRGEIARVARFASSVLITGPSGAGKELVARQIHALSPRASHAFVPVDCAAMAGELMTSQLFGHLAGAFTGANCDALGCFRAAHRGTLFLDEIGELEYPLQAKLLRVLQERVVTPVGSHRGEPVDVRVIAATNRDLQSEVLAGRFREDLYYRLDVVHLTTTPLRQRPEDVPALAEAFLKQLADEGLPRCTLSPEAIDALLAFHWPGNVRQLRNVLEQAAIDSHGPEISVDHLRRIISLSFSSDPPASGRAAGRDVCVVDEGLRPIATPPAPAPGPATATTTCLAEWPTLDIVEREHIAKTLAHTFHNRSAAARLLGVTRQSLLRKLKRYELDADRRPHC